MESKQTMNISDIEKLVENFEKATIPAADFNHALHLTVALWYVFHHPYEEAVDLIRNGIQNYNSKNNIVQTKDRGYHETLTIFWAHQIHKFYCVNRDVGLEVLANKLTQEFRDKKSPLQYYSRDLIMSQQARTTWVEPDLKALD